MLYANKLFKLFSAFSRCDPLFFCSFDSMSVRGFSPGLTYPLNEFQMNWKHFAQNKNLRFCPPSPTCPFELSVFIWVPDYCFKAGLKNNEHILWCNSFPSYSHHTFFWRLSMRNLKESSAAGTVQIKRFWGLAVVHLFVCREKSLSVLVSTEFHSSWIPPLSPQLI